MSPLSLIVPVVVAVLAAVAWAASPDATNGRQQVARMVPFEELESDPLLLAAADALESAGTVAIRATVAGTTTFVTQDFRNRTADVRDPLPGVSRRLVVGRQVYDQLADGSWVHPEVAPAPVVGQDVPEQLRHLAGKVDDLGGGRYRLRSAFGEGMLELDAEGLPVRLQLLDHDVEWELTEVSDAPLDVEVPADARPVRPFEYFELLAEAAATSR